MEKEYIHIVYDYMTHIENTHIISKQTFTLLKLYYKILGEKAQKRTKNVYFSTLVLLSCCCRSVFQKIRIKVSKGRY